MLLIVPNRKIKKAANIILLVAKLLNLYSHFAIDDQFERMAPTLVFFFMLVCRMVVDWQFVNNVPPPQVDINLTSQGSKFSVGTFLSSQVVEDAAQGSYDKVNIRQSLPRQAKTKKEQ